MKKFLILILICFVQNVFSQATTEFPSVVSMPKSDTPPPQGSIPNNDYQVYNTAGLTVLPAFPGGIHEFYSFMKKNYKTPDIADLKGKVYVSFIVEKDGSLSNIKTIQDIGHGTGQETIRVLKTSPKWQPALLKDKQVRALYSLPISINQPIE